METRKGEVLPIEVKSGKDYKRHVALSNLMALPNNHVSEACVLSEGILSVENREDGKVRHIPLHMLPFVVQEAATSSLAGVKLEPVEW